jgi:DNA-binding LacI/PurR family transcriptional regulator
MDDIARLANVDKSTVSRALAGNKLVAEETRRHVIRISEENGYILNSAASGLRTRKSKVIAVAVPLGHDARQPLSDPFFLMMVGHLADRLAEHGFDLLLSKVAAPSAFWIGGLFQSRRADGVILIGQSLEHDHICAAALDGIPLVVWGTRMKDQPYISVGTDNRAGGVLATEHLIERGRRRIAFIGDTRLPEIQERHAGYLAALRHAGLKADKNRAASSHFEADEAYTATSKLLARAPDTDAIVAASDVIAISAIAAANALKLRVPEDISVTGFDDIPMARHTNPPLTTVRQDVQRGAALLTQSLLARIECQEVSSTVMAPSLVIRGSS